ncbi:MAG: ABC transporter permease [Leucobacter sp.]
MRTARSIFVAALKKLGAAVLVVWITASVVFFALRASGNPLEAILGGPGSQASSEAVAQATADYGLDQPFLIQYLSQLWRIATLQFGDSYARKQPVADLLLANVPPTLVLATLAFALAWILAIAMTLAAATARGKFGGLIRATLTTTQTISSVMPQFFLGAVLILVFASNLQWLPATGGASGGLRALILPVFTLAVPIAGYLAHVLHGPLVEADSAPFATTARSRGSSESRVLFRHTLRHAALPAISLSGWAYGSLLSGAVVVEVLFARQGLGRLLLEATTVRDIPVVIGSVVIVALLYVVVLVITEIVEQIVDPRGSVRDGPLDTATNAATEVVV